MVTLADAEALDRADPLAHYRELFSLPESIIYLDGNSLGALPKAVIDRTSRVVTEQWGRDLITAWNVHDWIDLPARVGNKLAPLIGAPRDTVLVADSTSINIFKLLAVALAMRPGRRVILTEEKNFPTDVYVAGGIASLMGQGHEVRLAPTEGLAAAMTEDVAVVLLTEVNYRTGARLDMPALTAAAHRAGALIIWDLCHSAGAVPVDLIAANADFAVGCGYKFLNGGPGAPSFAYVAPRHLPGLRQPLQGWLGHAAPFDFAPDYRPAEGIDALRVGTPPILSMSALDTALDVFSGVNMTAVKRKADALFGIFTADLGDLELLLTPRDPKLRGSQINLRHPDAYAVMQALIGRGVIGDFRQPDIMRFGLTPLYLRHTDVWHAAQTLREILAARAWDKPEFKRRAKVV
jgi:kynureninase